MSSYDDALQMIGDLEIFNGAYAPLNLIHLQTNSNPVALATVLLALNPTGHLSQDLFDSLVNHKRIDALAEILQGPHAQTIAHILHRHNYSDEVIHVMKFYQDKGLLAEEYAHNVLGILQSNDNLRVAAKEIVNRHSGGTLSSSHPAPTAQQPQPASASSTSEQETQNTDPVVIELKKLIQDGTIRVDEARNLYNKLSTHANRDGIATAIVAFAGMGLLSGENAKRNLEAITERGDQILGLLRQLEPIHPENAKSFFYLIKAGAIDEECISAFSRNTTDWGWALPVLDRVGLLAPPQGRDNFLRAANHQSLNELSMLIKILDKNTDLLNGENRQSNFEKLINKEKLAELLPIYYELNNSEPNHLRSSNPQAFFDIICTSDSPLEACLAIEAVPDEGPLSGEKQLECIQTILEHPKCLQVIAALRHLKDTGLLTSEHADEYFQDIVEHDEPFVIGSSLKGLHETGLLSEAYGQKYYNIIKNHARPSDMARAIEAIGTATLQGGTNTTKRYFNRISQHTQLKGIAESLEALKGSPVLSGPNASRNIEAILQHRNALDLSGCLKILSNQGLFSGENAQENFDKVLSHQHLRQLKTLMNLHTDTGSKNLPKATFDQIISHSDILFGRKVGPQWGHISQAQYDKALDLGEILEFCNTNKRNPDVQHELAAHINDKVIYVKHGRSSTEQTLANRTQQMREQMQQGRRREATSPGDRNQQQQRDGGTRKPSGRQT